MRKGKPLEPKPRELFGFSSQAFALEPSTEVSSRNPRCGQGITLFESNILLLVPWLLVPCYLRKRFSSLNSTNRAKKGRDLRFQIVDFRFEVYPNRNFEIPKSAILNLQSPKKPRLRGRRAGLFSCCGVTRLCANSYLPFPKILAGLVVSPVALGKSLAT